MRNVRVKILMMVVVLAVANIASATTVRGIDIDFVTIGNAGNLGDTRVDANPTGCGAVDYVYHIGKYEISNAQWSDFVTAAGAPTGNPWYAYEEFAYFTSDNIPTNMVSWYEAAQFCNYLTSGDKSQGAYQFSGNNTNPGDFEGIDRDSAVSTYGIAFVIPTEDEWYKAAYYTGSGYSTYANGTDTAPIAGDDTNYDGIIGHPWEVGVGNGTEEHNGTFDMMGNVWEWTEKLSEWDETLSNRVFRGGVYAGDDFYMSSSRFNWRLMSNEYPFVGFRVAFICEPVMPISLDIKPQSCPNPLNVKSKGVLPVAILGSDSFDVTTIDATSIRLKGVGPIRHSFEDVAAPGLDVADCNCVEDGPDGFVDLTLKFRTQEIVEALGEVEDDDVITLELTGVLFDETAIEGADCILIGGRHKPINPADINKDGVVNAADFAIFTQNWMQSDIFLEGAE